MPRAKAPETGKRNRECARVHAERKEGGTVKWYWLDDGTTVSEAELLEMVRKDLEYLEPGDPAREDVEALYAELTEGDVEP